MALAHQLVERIGPSRYGTPTETTRISWIVDAVIDGSLRNRMERAILGIVAVGRPGFHRIDDYLTGVFYDNPAARDGLVEHVLANVWVNAFRGPRPNSIKLARPIRHLEAGLHLVGSQVFADRVPRQSRAPCNLPDRMSIPQMPASDNAQ